MFWPGYLKTLATFMELPPLPGIAFAGDYLAGPSTGAAYVTGQRAVNQVLAHLSGRPAQRGWFGFDDREPPFDAINRRMLATFEPYASEIATWFWGHEQHLMIFHPYKGLKGRCVGHGARPVSGSVIDRHTSFNFAYENVRLSLSDDGEHLNHGFEMIQIGSKGMPSEVSY